RPRRRLPPCTDLPLALGPTRGRPSGLLSTRPVLGPVFHPCAVRARTHVRRDMRFGYWTPVYGGFLRNVEDEGMPATWEYVRKVSTLADRLDFELTLVPELYINDRK